MKEMDEKDLAQASGGAEYTWMDEIELTREGYRPHPIGSGADCPAYVDSGEEPASGRTVPRSRGCINCKNALIRYRTGQAYCKIR